MFKYGLAAACGVILVGLGLFLLIGAGDSNESQTKQGSEATGEKVFPTSDSGVADKKMSVRTKFDSIVQVHDVTTLEASERGVLEGDVGYYLLRSNATAYALAYSPSLSEFRITLQQEPFPRTEIAAIEELAQQLRVTVRELCALRISVVSMRDGKEVDNTAKLSICTGS